MGMNIFYSPKRNRAYVRKFDYYEAQERYRAGESIRDLAAEFGVTYMAVRLVVIPEVRARYKEYQSTVYKGKAKCLNCGAPTNLLARKVYGSTRCIKCARKERVTEHIANTVRPDELWCSPCEAWHPDEEFGLYKSAKPYRRGRSNYCRKVNAKQKRDRRKAIADRRAETLK